MGDNIQQLTAKGFNLDQAKGSMESGQQKAVLVTWSPPADHDPNVAMEANVKLMVRGDVSETYNIMLRAIVTTTERGTASKDEATTAESATNGGGDSKQGATGNSGPGGSPTRPSPLKETAPGSVQGNTSETDLNNAQQTGGENKSPTLASLGATGATVEEGNEGQSSNQ